MIQHITAYGKLLSIRTHVYIEEDKTECIVATLATTDGNILIKAWGSFCSKIASQPSRKMKIEGELMAISFQKDFRDIKPCIDVNKVDFL